MSAPRRCRPGRAGALALTALSLGLPAAGEPLGAAAPCIASVELAPSRAVVGQQVLYRLRILSREEVVSVGWIEPPSFPHFRAERLPGRPEPGRVERDGAFYRAREEHRALFPERPGLLAVPPATLSCRLRRGGATRAHPAPVPGVALRVAPLPERDRPPGFAGVIGPLVLTAAIEPAAVSVGESARLTVELRGAGNLWVAADPLADRAGLSGAELFRMRPSLRFEPGVRLFVRRQFWYQLVPRREGALAVPEIRVPYFDPEKRRYAVATTPALRLAVQARPGDRDGGRGGGAATERRNREAPAEEGIDPRGLALAAAGLAAAAAIARGLRRRRRQPGVRAALASAEVARAAGDAAGEAKALSGALRAALRSHLPEARTATAEELLDRGALSPALADAAKLLAEVERARFDPAAESPDPADVERAVAALR